MRSLRLAGLFVLIVSMLVPVLVGCATPTAAPSAGGGPTAKPATSGAPAAAPTAASAAPSVATAAPAAAATKPAAATTAAAAPKIKRGGKLTGYETLYPTLDIQISTSAHLGLNSMIFDSLTRYDFVSPDQSKFELHPGLAVSWEYKDPTNLELKLRKGVKFHDGSDWNAEVAKWNFNRMLTHPKSVSKAILGDIGDVEIVDDSTIRLKLKSPNATMPVLLSVGGSWGRSRIVSKAAVEKLGDDGFGRNPVGTGPFKFKEWKPDSNLTLTKFDGYWEMGADGKPLPYLDEVESRNIPDAATRYLELRSGNIHVAAIDSKDVAQVKNNPDLVYWQLPWMWSARVVGLNAKKGIFVDKPKLRQAFAYGIDCESLGKALAPGLSSCDNTVWQEGQFGYEKNAPKYTYDPEKSKQLLKEAGMPDGFTMRMLTFDITDYQRAAELYQGMLSKVGIKLVPDILERLAWIAKAQTFEGWDAALWGWNAVTENDSISRNLVSTDLGNWSGVVNPERDKLMAQGRQTSDPAQRHQIYKRVWETVYEEANINFTIKIFSNLTYRKNVHGLRVEYGESWEPREAWIE
jgi:peptide/nickel transport system substrate-binding protein